MALAYPSSVGSKEQVALLLGSGDALASRFFAKNHLKTIPRTGQCQDLEENWGEMNDPETKEEKCGEEGID